MSTAPCSPKRRRMPSWFMTAFCVLLGAIMLGAFWIGGHLDEGLSSLAVMVVLGLVFLAGGRSDTIRGLRGDGRDERFAAIDLTATAVTGFVLVLAVIVGFLVEVARGHSGSPYAWLGALGGLSYIVAVAVLRWRS